MKKILFLLLCFPLFGMAQTYLPSYPALLHHFFSHYGYAPTEAVDGLNFAKKKDGWHVQVIDRVTEVVKTDQLYRPVKADSYLPLIAFEAPIASEEEKNIAAFLAPPGLYNFYGYERCLYHGYSQWAEDMIKDFGNGVKASYSDTLLEGLGRAYSAYASKFLWYQYGGANDNHDSLKRKLQPLELPSRQRMDSVAHYIGKAIETNKILEAKNNSYQMLLGNPGMKVFNEQMNAYMHCSMAGNDSLAHVFVRSVIPDKTIADMARNYLNACAPNAILFTFGDNDTYPLWYVQEQEGFRTDVAVIHTSLLGMPAYIDMLKRKHKVDFSSTRQLYGDSSFLYFLKEKKEDGKSLSLPAFIETIQSKKYTISSDIYGRLQAYSNDQITIDFDLNKFKKIWEWPNLKPVVKIEPGDYILNDQFMVLDIIHTNLYDRPVYFTASYELLSSSLLRTGPVFRFLPLDAAQQKLTDKISFERTKDYIDKYYTLIASNDSSAPVTAAKMDEEVFVQYALVADYYLKNGKKDSAVLILKELLTRYNNQLPVVIYESNVYEMLLSAGLIAEGSKLIEDRAALMYRLYKTPSASGPYLSRDACLTYITGSRYSLLKYGIYSRELDALFDALAKQ
jgi:hypothetical protein